MALFKMGDDGEEQAQEGWQLPDMPKVEAGFGYDPSAYTPQSGTALPRAPSPTSPTPTPNPNPTPVTRTPNPGGTAPPTAAPRTGVPPAGSGNSPQELADINASFGFPNFNPTTGKNNDGTTVTGPNGDPSHESLPVLDFLHKYQKEHPVSEGVGGITAALKQAGYNVAPYMYGNTASHNEISLDGKKFKVIGAEDSPNAYWYTGGDDSGPQGAARGQGAPLSGDFGMGALNTAGRDNPGGNVQVGQDPLSRLTDGSLASILAQGGRTTSDVGADGLNALSQYLKSGANSNARMESIREKFGLQQRAQMNDARGELASRGLLSEGSTAQGPEMSTLGRVNANIAPQWSAAVRDAMVQDDANMVNAIGIATGLDESAANRVLATAHTVNERQQILSDIALKSLDQNMQWNQFLAEFGLKRDTIMYQLQQGQFEALTPLINSFTNWLDKSAGGYI